VGHRDLCFSLSIRFGVLTSNTMSHSVLTCSSLTAPPPAPSSFLQLFRPKLPNGSSQSYSQRLLFRTSFHKTTHERVLARSSLIFVKLKTKTFVIVWFYYNFYFIADRVFRVEIETSVWQILNKRGLPRLWYLVDGPSHFSLSFVIVLLR
jgi:hypothetical protein